VRSGAAVAALVAGVLVLAGCGGSGSTGRAAPATRPVTVATLPPALDNGAQGLNQSHLPGHVPPAEACHDRVHATSASLVTRVLPDGPRHADGSLAFTAGVCVYLPPGYSTSGLRYPTIYLLHGGGGDAGDAVTFGHIASLMDARIARRRADAAIVVMPDGHVGWWYEAQDGSFQDERYVIDHVVPFVDAHFRTIASRHGRAIDGVSNGGLGALLLAAKHPGVFGVAGGMSSNLDALTLPGLGPADGPYWKANHPLDRVAGLDHTPLVLDIASHCTTTAPGGGLCFTQSVDAAFLPANRAFVAALRDRRSRHAAVNYRETDGAHQWFWWSRYLRDRHLPFLLAHLADPGSTAGGSR
jgi:enterochelin esterase-like enzyme